MGITIAIGEHKQKLIEGAEPIKWSQFARVIY